MQAIGLATSAVTGALHASVLLMGGSKKGQERGQGVGVGPWPRLKFCHPVAPKSK